MNRRYTYVWEFQIRPADEAAFSRYYGPEGIWAELFRQGQCEGLTRAESSLGSFHEVA